VHAIECRREARINRHLNDHFDDLLRRAADIQRTVNVHRQLRLAVGERGERRHGRQLALGEVQAGALIDVAEGKLDHVAGQVRCDGLQAVDDLAPGFAVNFSRFVRGRTAQSRKKGPGPAGCAANGAMRRCGTWQGNPITCVPRLRNAARPWRHLVQQRGLRRNGNRP